MNDVVMQDTESAAGRGRYAVCGANLRQRPGTCAKPAGWGTAHVGFGACRLHGGNTRTQVAGANRLQVEVEARRALRDFQVEPVTNPLSALAEHAAQVVTLRDFLRDQVARLESLRYQAGAGEQLRAELAAYQAALRDTTNVLAAYARLNIDERLMRITEAQGEFVAEALKAGLRAAGIGEHDPRYQAAKDAIVQTLRTAQRPARKALT